MKKLTFLILILLLSACSKAAPKATATLVSTPSSTPVTPATLPPTTPQQATFTPVAPITASQTATPTQSVVEPTHTPTSTPLPTTPPLPTDTSTSLATDTPIPPLSVQGPYLVYLSTLPEGGQAITLLNADGNGREVLPLPANGFIPDVRNAVSPDGAWVSFYIGNAGKLDSGVFDTTSGPFTLTLNLMSLADGSTRRIASLLSTDYPTNFQTTADLAIQGSPDTYKDVTPEQLTNSIAQTFLGGLYTTGWSSNSLYLAFTGETDGPTSDLYIYTVATGRTFRLTSELEQIQWLTWSSDNLTLLYATTNQYVEGSVVDNFRVIRINGSAAQNLGQLGYRAGWASATVYTAYSTGQNGGFSGLTNTNIFTRNATVIWAYPFLDFAFDLQDGTMAIIGYSGEGADQQTGIYLQAANWLFVPLNAISVFPRGGATHRFIALSVDQGIVGIAQDGAISTIRAQTPSALISISPNWKWMALFDAGQSGNIIGIELYDENDQLVKQPTSLTPSRIIWRADSSGLFFRSGTELYYLAIPDGQPVLIDQNVAVSETGDYNNFIWIK